MWKQHPEGPEHERGLELMRSVLARAQSDENLAMVPEMAKGWQEEHGVQLAAEPAPDPEAP